MTTAHTGTILRQIANLVDVEATRELTDTQLLQRFVEHGEQTAFAALMQRHGGLVWGVCQHLLRHQHDAEDAFQATFLVLARRAEAIRKSQALASFLHGVAYRVAMKARQNTQRRLARERRTAAPAQVQPPADLAWRELQAILDDEVQRLPQKYRGPFVLCCLEGMSRHEAARQLGCKEGTVFSRVARARRLLQERLAGRGVTLPAALCAGVLWQESGHAAVPAALASRTLDGVAGAPGAVSAAAAALAKGVVSSRWHLSVLLLGLTFVAAGAGLWGTHAAAPPAQPKGNDGPAVAARRDRHGDALPPGALARLGTVRQRAPGSHLAVTADGKEVVAVGPDMIVRRFDARTGELRSLRQLPRNNPLRYPTWLSPRATFVLTLIPSQNQGVYELELWDLAQWKVRASVSFSEYPFGGATFSADERRVVVVAGLDPDKRTGPVLIWDLDTFRSRLLLPSAERNRPPDAPVVVLSPDGKRLVSCHGSGPNDRTVTICCWNVEDGKLLWRLAEEDWARLVVFSPDGRTVVTGRQWGSKKHVTFRDAATGKPIAAKGQPPKLLGQPIGFSPNGRFLALLTGQGGVVLWEVGKDGIALRLPPPPHRRDQAYQVPDKLPGDFAFTPDSKAIIRRAAALQRWDLDTGKLVYADTESWGHTEDVTRLLFSPDGRWLASLAKDQTARLWEVSTARPAHTFPRAESEHLAFTPDSRLLLTLPYGVPGMTVGNTVLHATDVVTGRPARRFELVKRDSFWPTSRNRELLVTPDGKKVMILSNGPHSTSVLTAWETASGKLLVNREVPWGESSLLTPDGQAVLMFDSKAEEVRFLDVETGKQRWRLTWDRRADPQRKPQGCDLALSPDGRLMAARLNFFKRRSWELEYGAIRMGDLAARRQVHKLPVEGLAAFAFSADGRLFAVADQARIQLWETASWKAVGSIHVPDRGGAAPDRPCASSLVFAPAGRILATGHADGAILLWDATLRGGVRGGPLTAAERSALWTDLAGPDAARAHAAVWRLADDSGDSVAFVGARLRPVLAVPRRVVKSLLDDLDSDEFKVRVAAEQKLREHGVLVEPALREALQAKPSLEKRRRIQSVLAALERGGPLSGEPLRDVRAVAVLEGIGSVQAQQLLERLARGAESAHLTKAAKAALRRLKKG
jgi:RNA polymerase sigma factor (sigma-70 family)